jgi:hypothetical protein
VRAIERVYCDESGHTGQNLADLSQPVFAFAATLLDRAEAERLLDPFAVLNQAELKYSKVRRTTKGQKLIETLLADAAIQGETSKVYLIHKPFMIVSKIVDMIYEPQLHKVGENFYSQKTALATANLIATTYPVFGGKTRFYRLLESFVKAVRAKDDATLARFFREAREFKEFLEQRHGEDGGLELVPVLVEERAGAPHIRGADIDELDPIVPAFNVHAGHWSRESSCRFVVVADRSAILERNHQVFLDYSNPAGRPITADYYGQRIEYPLKIERFSFVDSQSEPSVRLADLLAGIVAEAAAPMANRETPTPYQRDLRRAVLDKKLLLNAMWPSTDVTPESLNAVGHTHLNPASIAADFLHSVHQATNPGSA